MSVLITTEILGEHPVLTSVSTKLDLATAWVRSGDGLIGFGEYKRFEVKGENRFNDAVDEVFRITCRVWYQPPKTSYRNHYDTTIVTHLYTKSISWSTTSHNPSSITQNPYQLENMQ